MTCSGSRPRLSLGVLSTDPQLTVKISAPIRAGTRRRCEPLHIIHDSTPFYFLMKLGAKRTRRGGGSLLHWSWCSGRISSFLLLPPLTSSLNNFNPTSFLLLLEL